MMALRDYSDLGLYLTDRLCRWDGPGYNYGGKLEKLRRQYGTPRRASVIACVDAGWIGKQEVDWHVSPYGLTDIGRTIAEKLTFEDTARAEPVHTEAKILETLAAIHPLPDWIFIRHLKLRTGFSGGKYVDIPGAMERINMDGTLDGFAIHAWPSKKYLRVAYEVKISKADFDNELEHGEKRLGAEFFANECYFAAPPGIIKPEQLPLDWGLVEVAGERVETVVKSSRNQAADLTMGLIVSMCRNLMMGRE